VELGSRYLGPLGNISRRKVFMTMLILYNYWLWNRLLSGFINLKKSNIHWAAGEVNIRFQRLINQIATYSRIYDCSYQFRSFVVREPMRLRFTFVFRLNHKQKLKMTMKLLVDNSETFLWNKAIIDSRIGCYLVYQPLKTYIHIRAVNLCV
jgi:hypothetical protein